MKKLLHALMLLSLIQTVLAQPLENSLQPAGFVNDYAGVLDKTFAGLIESAATDLEKNTSAEIFIAVIKHSGQLSIKDYATDLFNRWKIGKKGKDNGILILLSVEGRRIEVEAGYGLEGLLPDSKIGRVLDENAVPLLKEGKYGEGLFNLVQQFSTIIKTGGEYPKEPSGMEIDLLPFAPFIIIFLIIIFAGFSERPPKCDACKTRMKKEDYYGKYATVTYVCPKCKKKKKRARHRSSGAFIFIGGGPGGHGGGWGGAGGGSSGGGGAGRGF